MSKVFTITEGLENMGALRTGGQGSVYKGRRMGAIISAVKLLPTPIYTEDKTDKNFRSFQNEVDKLKKVNEDPNPNVVKILNSGLTESGSFPYIEMEFIEGPDLEDLLQPPHNKIFTVKEVIKLADHLANALAHCHRVGVKHGDIKSNNVKYNIHSGNYVLLDFGLAIMSDEERRTSIRHAGAIEFMAPEQNTGAMLFETDIYSYGIILYELLAGQVPFPLHDSGETSRNSVMIAHMEQPVPDVMTARRLNLPENWTQDKKDHEMNVPAWLLQLIAKCLEKDPANRFSNGMVLQDALFYGDIETREPEIAQQNFERLRAQNEELNSRIAAYQQQELQSMGFVKIPKSWLFGATVLFLALLFWAGYGAIKGNTVVPVIKRDTVYVASPPRAALKNNIDFNPVADTMVKKQLPADTVVKVKPKHVYKKKRKVKRKKFLGIF